MSGGGHGRRAVHEEHEEHENHERWLVSYADMMTLLMVLFIVLFAISQVDATKFAALATGLSTSFGTPTEVLPGGPALLEPGGAVAPDTPSQPIRQGEVSNPAPSINPAKVAELATATEQERVKAEVNNLKEAQKELRQALVKAGLKNGANFRFNERGLVVTIATDNVLFDSGSAVLQARGERILRALGPTLRALPNHLSIDGHTNSIPIRTAQFPSNWELSGARASNVLRYMQRADRIPFRRMTFTGFADTQPRLPDSNPRSVVVNRRVEIIVEARVDDSSGRAVEELGNTASRTK
jgi:chemotaxis protein MotB